MFSVYKKKQGMILRWGTFIVSSVLFVFGSYRFFYSFPYINTLPEKRPAFWQQLYSELLSFNIPLVDIPIVVSPRLLISLGLGLVLLLLTTYFCFKHARLSDFLIDTESEMRKVSWPTRNEVVSSSVVVILVMIFLSVYLFAVDWGFGKLFRWIFF